MKGLATCGSRSITGKENEVFFVCGRCERWISGGGREITGKLKIAKGSEALCEGVEW